jgi:hypothetical protein
MHSSRYHSYVEQDIEFKDLELDKSLEGDFERAILKLKLMNEEGKGIKFYEFQLFINEKGFIDSLKNI